MANRIYITHSDGVTPQEAIDAVYAGLVNYIEPGVCISFPNGMAVFYKDKTKHPSFQVWRKKK